MAIRRQRKSMNRHEPHGKRDKRTVTKAVAKGAATRMEYARLADYALLLNRPLRLIWLNLLSGTFRGVGIAIGFTFFAATIIYILQVLGALNLPIIGDYIADIVRIVQRQLELTSY
ncbi:hypothetical protein D3C74_20660 [compost metagenome]